MTTEQKTLPFVRHSRTSKLAAIDGRQMVTGLRREVLAEIEIRGTAGATDEELQAALDLNPSTQRPRRIELVNAGLVFDSGRTRRTRSGRSAAVWVANGCRP